MAQHGGRLSGCYVESTHQLQPWNETPVITLSHPRPGMARRQNDYIETPLRRNKTDSGSKYSDDSESASDSSASGLNVSGGKQPKGQVFFSSQLAVTTQPSIATFKKEKVSEPNGPQIHADSIICHECGLCKCESCRSPKRLPTKWICNDKCLCSADNFVDYCSCLCCIKGLFYHLAKDYDMDDDVSCADHPCSCIPHKRCVRWSCLAFMSAILPCLCCYWPLRGCVKSAETCYAASSSRGCRCTQRRTIAPAEKAPDKLLLDSNSDC